MITPTEYGGLQQAYDFFNEQLFSGTLPQLLLTFQRKPRTRGYFSPERFTGRIENGAVHELALNPDAFAGRSDEEVLSTLVHEMVHVWQQTNGTPPRRCYHDRQWANKMKEVGLQPSDTGEAGGKETGQTMTHYIMKDGAFAHSYAELQNRGFQLHWQSQPEADDRAVAKRASKTKFTCPSCGQNAWAKADAQLICGECYEADGDVVALEPQA